MSANERYLRDERLILGFAGGVALIVTILAFFFGGSISPKKVQLTPEEVWEYIQVEAPKADLDPEFVYALAWAESSLNARARSSVARGIMQLTEPAWAEVTDESYRLAWDWKTNIRVGIGYLAFCRDFLKQHDSFSYPILAASFRYGPYHVEAKNFNLKQLKRPRNEIYRRIFDGEIHPVLPPEDRSADLQLVQADPVAVPLVPVD